jgi:hypothetical protein
LGKLKLCQSKTVTKTLLLQLCQAGRTAEITVALCEAEKLAGRTYADVPALTVAIAVAYKCSESERVEVCKLLQAERAPGGLLAGAPELTVPADVNTVYFAGGTLSVLGSLKAQKRTFGSVAELVAALTPGATAGAQAQQPAVVSRVAPVAAAAVIQASNQQDEGARKQEMEAVHGKAQTRVAPSGPVAVEAKAKQAAPAAVVPETKSIWEVATVEPAHKLLVRIFSLIPCLLPAFSFASRTPLVVVFFCVVCACSGRCGWSVGQAEALPKQSRDEDYVVAAVSGGQDGRGHCGFV